MDISKTQWRSTGGVSVVCISSVIKDNVFLDTVVKSILITDLISGKI